MDRITKIYPDGRMRIHGVNSLIIFYYSLTIYEPVLNTGSGSILKYYGYILIAVILLTMWKRNNSLKVRIRREFFPLLIWFGIAIISLLWSINSVKGFDYVLSMGNVFLIALLVTNISWNAKEIKALFLSYSISSLLFSIILIMTNRRVVSDTLRYTVKIFNATYDPNVVVGFIAPGVILLMFLFAKKLIKWYLVIPGTIIIVYAVFLTASRGGAFSLGAATVFYFIAYMIKKRISIKKILNVFVMIICAYFLIAFIVSRIDVSIVNRIFHLDMLEGSSIDRVNLLKQAFSHFMNNPILGLGCGGLDAVTNNHGAHNMYMFVLADMGIVGFIPFIVMLIVFFRSLWSSENWELTALLVCTCGVIFFLDSYHAKYFWNTLVFILLSQHIDNNLSYTNEVK